MAATGWLPYTTRAALMGLRKRGYALTREAAKGGSVHRIASGDRCCGLRRWLTADTRQPGRATPCSGRPGSGRGGDRLVGAASVSRPPGGVPQPHRPDRTGPHLQGPAVQGSGPSRPSRSVGRPPARHPPHARSHHRRFRRAWNDGSPCPFRTGAGHPEARHCSSSSRSWPYGHGSRRSTFSLQSRRSPMSP